MQPNLFAPPGLDLLVGGEPLAQSLHRTALRLFSNSDIDNGGLSTEEGSLVDLFCFLLSISLATAITTVQRVGAERTAAGAYFSLPKQEAEHGLIPAFGETLRARRLALAAAKRVPLGSRRPELEQMLRDLLGEDYVGLHVASGAEVVAWPAALGDNPQLLVDAFIPRILTRITPAICTDLGTLREVVYEAVDPLSISGAHTLTSGDRLVVEPENLHRAEVVTVIATGHNSDGLTFSAVFDNAHEPACLAVQMPFPVWATSQRRLLIALTADAASDPEARRKANTALEKAATGVTTWSLCGESAPGKIGPWTIGEPQLGLLGQNPLTEITVP